jgi:hypothetical protein
MIRHPVLSVYSAICSCLLGPSRQGLPPGAVARLRHTYAGLFIEPRETIKYIQIQLGNSIPAVTLDIEAHLMKSVNQEAACGLEPAVVGEDENKMATDKKKGLRPQP